METTAIKVHVSPDIYGVIKDIQQNLRVKEGKKTSLAEIIIRLTQKGIDSLHKEQENEQKTQNFDNSAQNKDDFAHNSKHFTPESEEKSLIISSKESKSYDELSIRQEYLTDREAEIRDIETELYDEREKILNRNRELLRLEEEISRKQYEMKYNSLESNLINNVDKYIEKVNFMPEPTPVIIGEKEFENVFDKLSDIKEQLSDIKRETQHENIKKYLERLHENDDRIIELIQKGNQKTTLQKFEPVLPVIGVALVNYFMNKNDKNGNSDEILNEIKALMGELSEKEEKFEDRINS